MALAPTLAQGVKPHEDRRRPDRTLPVGKHHWWGHVLPRPRSNTPAISSKLKLFRRFLLRRTHLAFVCFLFLAVWSSTCRNLDHRQQRRHFLVDWPCHFVTFPHHHFRGDLRNRLHPSHTIISDIFFLFLSDLWWLDCFPFEEHWQKVRHSIQLLLLSPRSISNSQKFNIHMPGYEFVALKWILWRVKFGINERIATDRILKIHEIQQ